MEDAQIRQLLEDFLSPKRETRTEEHYRNALNTFARFVGRPHREAALAHLLSLDSDKANQVVRAFSECLVRQGKRPGRTASLITPVRAFANFAHQQGAIDWTVSLSRQGRPRPVLALPVRAPKPAPTPPRPKPRRGFCPEEAAQLVELLGAHNRNTNTRRTYDQAFKHFAAFTRSKSIGAALADLLRGPRGRANRRAMEYLQAMRGAQLSSSTMAVRIAALRAYIRLAYDIGFVEWRLSIRPPKIENSPDVRGPTAEGVRSALKALSKKRDPGSRRDYALLWMLASTGLRASELLGIDLADLDLERSRARILGKGRSKPELITIPPEAARAIKGWLEIRGTDPGPLFTGLRDGTRLRRESLWRICQAHGLGRTHGLRHFGVTTALDLTNGDLRRVAKFSRHRNLNTLVLYDDLRTDAAGDIARLIAGDLNNSEPLDTDSRRKVERRPIN